MAIDQNSFEELIRQRCENDQKAMDDAYAQIEGAVKGKSLADVLGRADHVADSAIARILKFYHCKPVKIPNTIKGIDARLDYAMKPFGIMRRNVELTPGWHKDAVGVFLAIRKDTGKVTALMPKRRLYYFHDTETGRTVRVTSRNEDLFEREALCFYAPFPQGKLDRYDLFWFFVHSVAPTVTIGIVITALVSALVTALIPALIQVLMGDVVHGKDVNLFISVSVFLIAAAVSGSFITAMRTLLTGQLNQQGLATVQAALMMRVLNLPLSFFNRYGAGDLSYRIFALDTVWNVMTSVLFGTGITAVASLVYILQLFSMSEDLFGYAVAVIVSMAVLTVAIVAVGVPYQRRAMAAQVARNRFELEMVSGVQKVKLSGSEQRIFSRWADRFSEVLRINYNQPAIVKYGPALVSLVAAVGTAFIFASAADSHVAVEDFYAFMTSYGYATAVFVSLSGVAGMLAQAQSAFDLLIPFFEEEPEISGDQTVPTDLKGRIEISHVSFRYNENAPYVLQDLSLTVEPGEYVAVVGKTGCGKSTLMRILLGFESPERGAVLYDGRDLTGLDKGALRRSIGVVMQNARLLQGDLLSNITLSRPELTEKEAWEAAEIASIADDIRAMPMRMHTMIGSGSGGLSGGQRQRVAIARAIVAKPKVLLFDEATSALDNKTQRDISDALGRMNCTRIVIAHRLSTIRQCYRVVVLDGGRIVADGTFDEVYEDYLK